jgi:tripeptide aminopeptidase
MTIGAQSRVELTPQQQIMQVASLRSVHRAFEWFRVHENELRAWQMELAGIPAPPFGEAKRSAWLSERFRELGLSEVDIDAVGNVSGLSKGTVETSVRGAVAVSAHIDTVFPAGTDVKPWEDRGRLYGPGISDNASGVAAILAIAKVLNSAAIEHQSEIVFIGNVGEEGEGDLRGMRHIFAQETWRRRIGYTLVIDGTGNDAIVSQALGSRRFEVVVRGPGGHSWSDFGLPNPIVVLARVIASFSRTAVPSSPKTAFNIGTIAGGTSVNSIPEMASARVDMRSSSTDEISRLESALNQAIVKEIAEASRAAVDNLPQKSLTWEMRNIGDRPAGELPQNARILEVIRGVDSHLGISSHLRRASTDANIPLSLGLEAISIGAGGQGGGAHTLHEWFDPAGRDLGLKRILLTVLALSGIQ